MAIFRTQKSKKENLRKQQNERICYAMQVSQGLYYDVTPKWQPVAESEKQAALLKSFGYAGGCDFLQQNIQLPQSLVLDLAPSTSKKRGLFSCLGKNSEAENGEEQNVRAQKIVKITVQQRNPCIQMFFRLGGAGQSTEQDIATDFVDPIDPRGYYQNQVEQEEFPVVNRMSVNIFSKGVDSHTLNTLVFTTDLYAELCYLNRSNSGKLDKTDDCAWGHTPYGRQSGSCN